MRTCSYAPHHALTPALPSAPPPLCFSISTERKKEGNAGLYQTCPNCGSPSSRESSTITSAPYTLNPNPETPLTHTLPSLFSVSTERKKEGNAGLYQTCPNCGQSILASELDDHIRIELLDPRWREQKERLARERAQGQEVYASGMSVSAVAVCVCVCACVCVYIYICVMCVCMSMCVCGCTCQGMPVSAVVVYVRVNVCVRAAGRMKKRRRVAHLRT